MDLAVCPQLQTLNVRFGTKLAIPDTRSLHLNKLKSLSFTIETDTNLLDIQRMLLAAPNLTLLEISVESDMSIPYPLTITSTLLPSSLTGLYLGDGDRAVVLGLLKWLECPNLTNFEMAVPLDLARNVWEQRSIGSDLLLSLEEFFVRSNPPLRTLKLSYVNDRHAAPRPAEQQEHARLLRRILRLLDKLDRLFLADLVINNRLIEDMTFRGDTKGDGPICPQLVGISFFCDHIGVEPQAMADMIVSRWRSTERHLEHVTLGLRNFERIHRKHEALGNCILEGLDFRFFDMS